VAKLIDLLPKRSDVLEIGCGNGEPAARLLAAGNDYTGIDVSAAQLERARAHVPDATFLQADYTVFEPSALVDAVVAILTTTHVPRTEHPELLHRIARWLRRGGLLLATFGSGDLPDRYEDDWLGAPMFFSHYDAETNLRLLEEAGFDLVKHEIVPMIEEGHGEVRFLWVLARRA